MKESLCTYECVLSHITMSHATHMDESCPTNKCVILHTCTTTHVTNVHESCQTPERLMSNMQMCSTLFQNNKEPYQTLHWPHDVLDSGL